MNLAKTIRGPILNPRAGGTVEYIADGAMRCDMTGKIDFFGDFASLPADSPAPQTSRGIITPPFLDAHIHIPQHPIRGRFMEGIGPGPAEGRLIAGLNRNIFPAEGKCADETVAREVVKIFLADTLSKGVVGGSAYMTVHAQAARAALEILPGSWSVGLVLMNMNCPPYLCTDETPLEQYIRELARDFGRRLIITDRFAVTTNTSLRRRGVALAQELGLRMQTHLNEQRAEKHFVEHILYTDYASYTDVYLRDGLLDREAILAHCIHMTDAELDTIASKGCAVAHCPTSNTLLGSGIMPLDAILSRDIPYSICTDVAASPTVSLLAEMAQFLKVHAARSNRATPSEALYRATLAPAEILGISRQIGTFAIGSPMSFVEFEATPTSSDIDRIIAEDILGLPGDWRSRYSSGRFALAFETLAAGEIDLGSELQLLESDIRDAAKQLDGKVLAVTESGREIWSVPPPSDV